MLRASALRKSLIFIHRWLGVALCLLFLLWFTSGIAMMYCDFPGVSEADRLEHSPALDPWEVRLSPSKAFDALHPQQRATEVRLTSHDGRPVYSFLIAGKEKLVYADTGELPLNVNAATALRIGAAWIGKSAATGKIEPIDLDQWTVPETIGNLRPFWKCSWSNGEQVYVSAITGQVVQYTSTQSRFWAYLGPIPHWLYFTPLRRHSQEWRQFIICASGAGVVSAILGITIGISMYSPRKGYRHRGERTAIPYRGIKRWHTMLGLIFGTGAVTWVFSGMLSMDPFPTGTSANMSGNNIAAHVAAALRGPLELPAFDSKTPGQALAQLAPLQVRELELISFEGQPTYIARTDRESRIVPLPGEPTLEFGIERVVATLRHAAGANVAALSVMNQYGVYYLDRRHVLPLPVLELRLNDAEHTRLYVDPKTARVAGVYNSRLWTSRWLYHALHSLDVPWLYKYRPLWDAIVISFMLGGTALSLLSVVLAWRVLKRNSALAASPTDSDTRT